MCEALIYLLDNIYIRFGTKLYRQIIGVPIGTDCAPLVADLFLFCHERDFMTSLSDVKQAEIVGAFKSTSRYLDDILNIDNPYFEGMVNRIYPPELQLKKANTSDTEAQFFGFSFLYFKRFLSLLHAGGSGVRLSDGPDIKLFILVGCGRSFSVCCLAHRGSTVGFLLLQCSSGFVRHPRDLQVSVTTRCFCRVLIFVSS